MESISDPSIRMNVGPETTRRKRIYLLRQPRSMPIAQNREQASAHSISNQSPSGATLHAVGSGPPLQTRMDGAHFHARKGCRDSAQFQCSDIAFRFRNPLESDSDFSSERDPWKPRDPRSVWMVRISSHPCRGSQGIRPDALRASIKHLHAMVRRMSRSSARWHLEFLAFGNVDEDATEFPPTDGSDAPLVRVQTGHPKVHPILVARNRTE